MEEILENIARDILSMATLKNRGSDSLDFEEHSVDSIREALEAAFKAGKHAKSNAIVSAKGR